jgi:hypothetical protein
MTDTAKKEVPTYTFKSAVRAAFMNIIAARSFQKAGQAKGEPRYDATFILEPDSEDLKAVKDLAITLAKANNPGKKLVARRLTQNELDDGGYVEINVPWKDGTKLADKAREAGKDQEFFRGKIVLKAGSKYAPALSAIQGAKVVEFNDPDTRSTHAKEFYSGGFYAPMIGFNTYKASGDPSESGYKPGGVGLWLNAICFVKNGPRLGGAGVNAAEVFKGYIGSVTEENPGSNDSEEF